MFQGGAAPCIFEVDKPEANLLAAYASIEANNPGSITVLYTTALHIITTISSSTTALRIETTLSTPPSLSKPCSSTISSVYCSLRYRPLRKFRSLFARHLDIVHFKVTQ